MSRILLLDVDGTIVHRHFVGKMIISEYDKLVHSCLLCHSGNFARVTKDHIIYIHPHFTQWIDLLASRSIQVGIYSAAPLKNILPVVEHLFGKGEAWKQKLVCVLGRESTHPRPTAEKPFGVTKDLDLFWKQFPQFGANNTLIMDDTASKLVFHEKHLVLTPTFEHVPNQHSCTNLSCEEWIKMIENKFEQIQRETDV